MANPCAEPVVIVTTFEVSLVLVTDVTVGPECTTPVAFGSMTSNELARAPLVVPQSTRYPVAKSDADGVQLSEIRRCSP
ncbi:unannotated protein [freshwater metagenome]|uniref:Unannotated protein n=1 Tax=freshwater metagenome TaxID=449393 RepID=A0A6J7PKG9_9ZZZZ